MTAIKRIAELDALRDGAIVVGLDPQATVVHKRGGHWIDLRKPPGTTWNVRTYVMARRYGVRAVAEPERNTAVSAIETTPTLTDQLKALIDHYQAREDERTADIESWFDEEGDVKDGNYDGYDSAKWDASEAARDDLTGFLAELAGLLQGEV